MFLDVMSRFEISEPKISILRDDQAIGLAKLFRQDFDNKHEGVASEEGDFMKTSLEAFFGGQWYDLDASFKTLPAHVSTGGPNSEIMPIWVMDEIMEILVWDSDGGESHSPIFDEELFVDHFNQLSGEDFVYSIAVKNYTSNL